MRRLNDFRDVMRMIDQQPFDTSFYYYDDVVEGVARDYLDVLWEQYPDWKWGDEIPEGFMEGMEFWDLFKNYEKEEE